MADNASLRGKLHGTTIPDKKAPCPLDKVNREFRVPAPNMLWGRPCRRHWSVRNARRFHLRRDLEGVRLCHFRHRCLCLQDRRLARKHISADRFRPGCTGAGAVHDRRSTKARGLVHHSNRGPQYLSIRDTDRLGEAGIEPSVAALFTRTDGVPRRPLAKDTTMRRLKPSTA